MTLLYDGNGNGNGKFRQTIDLGVGQTSNLTFDESYGNEQNINSVSAWNVLVHFFADNSPDSLHI